MQQEEIPMSYRILVINPGSTSTKIGVYEDETCLLYTSDAADEL